jgi:hypothetical protein
MTPQLRAYVARIERCPLESGRAIRTKSIDTVKSNAKTEARP